MSDACYVHSTGVWLTSSFRPYVQSFLVLSVTRGPVGVGVAVVTGGLFMTAVGLYDWGRQHVTWMPQLI